MKIEIRKIAKSYGRKELFKGLTHTFKPGTITAIMGNSGSGKTTLLNIIGLIESYDSGEIIYDRKIIKNNKDIRILLKHHIAFIFQNFGLLENKNVQYNLRFSHKMKRMSRNSQLLNIKKVLKEVELDNYENKEILSLSGGEQQRVAIAKAILKDASVILADEPTASIDLENEKIIMKLLKDLANQNKTIIIVTHSIEVTNYADKILYI